MFERFLFGFFGINFLFIERKLVENFYFDMNDKNVYYEIIDDLIRIENVYVFSQFLFMILLIFIGKKNLNKSKNKILQFIGKQDFEEMYILCQILDRDSRFLLLEFKKLDMDGSLLFDDNDGYGIYQLVDV